MRRGGARTTCWRELRGGSEAKLKLLLGAEILGSEDPRSRGDHPAVKVGYTNYSELGGGITNVKIYIGYEFSKI